MKESKTFKSFIHPLATVITGETRNKAQPDFFRKREENLISLLILYITTTGEITSPSYSGIIKSLKELLDEIKSPEQLRTLPDSLSGEVGSLKEIWKSDGFFHTTEGWEEQDDKQILITLAGVKNTVNQIYSIMENSAARRKNSRDSGGTTS